MGIGRGVEAIEMKRKVFQTVLGVVVSFSLLMLSSCERLGLQPSDGDDPLLSSLLRSSSSGADGSSSSGDGNSSNGDGNSSNGDGNSSGVGKSSSSGQSGSHKNAEGPFNAYIAPWPGNAIAAYTLIADDFCGGLAGQIHADTMMANRGLPMAFGAIVGKCGAEDWVDALAKIERGHEIVNHSWDHPCFTNKGECGSGPVVGPDAYALQLMQSSDKIENETGVYPRFFIFPYDRAPIEAINYLRNLGYFGSRTGQQMALNDDVFDPFSLNYDVNWPVGPETYQRWTLNEMIDTLLEQGYGWAIREMHGVDDGWGPVPYAEMQAHANYLKEKVNEGVLWVATPTQVIQYHCQRNYYDLKTEIVDGVYSIDFINPLLDLRYTDPVTLVIEDLPEEVLSWEVKQEGRGSMIMDNSSPLKITIVPGQGKIELIPE